MKNGANGNPPAKAMELGQDDLQAISAAISDEAKEVFKEVKKLVLHEAAEAARRGDSKAASDYSHLLEEIAILEASKK